MAKPIPVEDSNNSQSEYELERYMQLRDEIHDAIEKIEPNVSQLQEVTKRFVSQFDIFQKLSEDAREQIKTSLKEVSKEIANTAAQEFSQKIDSMITDKVKGLDSSIQNARNTLDRTMGGHFKSGFFLSGAGILLSGVICFGLGYFYSKNHTYSLPPDFIKMYSLGHTYKDALEKLPLQEKQKVEKRLFLK